METSWYHKLLVILASTILSFAFQAKELMIGLFALVVLDTILGVTKALKYHTFSSTKFRASLSKILFYMMIIVSASIVDFILSDVAGLFLFVTKIAIGFLGISEFLSILENLYELGAHIPYVGILRKLNHAVPFFRGNIRKFTTYIMQTSPAYIGDPYDSVFVQWKLMTQQFFLEMQNIDFDSLDDREKKTLIDALKSRLILTVKSRLTNQTRDALAYLKYLASLYDKYPPINERNMYILTNEAINYDFRHDNSPKKTAGKVSHTLRK